MVGESPGTVLETIQIAVEAPDEATLIEETVDERSTQGFFLSTAYSGHKFDNATFHLRSLRLDGKLLMSVVNTGRGPLIRPSLQKWAAQANIPLFQTSRSLGFILRRGARSNLSHSWSVKSGWSSLWALLQAFLTRSVEATLTTDLRALGYSKSASQRLRVPVGGVSVQWN